MSVKHLNLRDLNYICTVAKHLNFGQAAEMCAISQPAMSGRIQRIEEILDCRIFERSRRSVLVTETGAKIVTLAQSILDTAESIDQLTRQTQKPLTGSLSLGLISTLGPYLMPLILGPLHKEFPELKLQITEGLTEDLLGLLTAGSLDVVIVAKPVEHPGLKTTELFFEPFILATPKRHPLAKVGAVSATQLNGRDMVLLSEGHCLSGQALSVCPTTKRQGEMRLQAASLETLRHMIATGTHYSLLPYLAVGKNPTLKSLINYSPLAESTVGRTIMLCSRRSSERVSDIAALASLIKRTLPAGVTTLK